MTLRRRPLLFAGVVLVGMLSMGQVNAQTVHDCKGYARFGWLLAASSAGFALIPPFQALAVGYGIAALAVQGYVLAVCP